MTKQNLQEQYQKALQNGVIKNTFLDNSLFNKYFLAPTLQHNLQEEQSFYEPYKNDDLNYENIGKKNLFAKLPKSSQIQRKNFENFTKIFKQISNFFNSNSSKPNFFESLSEADIEHKIVSPLLNALGFEYVSQYSTTIADITYRVDFLAFSSNYAYEKYQTNQQIDKSCVIVEVKKWDTPFDRKISNNDTNYPQRQLLNYLYTLGLSRGILTSGNKWWLYDVSQQSKNALILGVDIFKMFTQDSGISENNFYNLFNAKNFSSENFFEELHHKNLTLSEKLEEDLKEVIYGEVSILEEIGKAIYKLNQQAQLQDIYYNALIFLFRIIFMLFYENKYGDFLYLHRSYKLYSIYELFKDLQENKASFKDLIKIWTYLNEGDETHNIPLLNGGLFDNNTYQLLNDANLFSNDELEKILTKLITNKDYKNLSTTQLGNIYEGLLNYEFKIASTHTYLVQYKEKSKTTSYTFLDFYFYEKMLKYSQSKSSNIENFKLIQQYLPRQLYLTSLSDQRKTSASYYTPMDLCDYMVEQSITNQLNNNVAIDEIKIIDNACGSGHFLVSALNCFSNIIENNENYKASLQKIFDTEKAQIYNNINAISPSDEIAKTLYPSDRQIIKRILLKKSIYGVDLNPIAIEITKISLWIETFIFGTPLSLIEHHIKVGNSLIFSSLQDLDSKLPQDDLFFDNKWKEEINNLKTEFKKLEQLNDINANEIKQSKQIHQKNNLIIEKLNKYLNFINYVDFCNANNLKIDTLAEYNLFLSNSNIKFNNFVKTYNPFNIDLQFIDSSKFNCVVGNPPWDVTSFGEKDFYSQYYSNYRNLSNNEKNQTKEILHKSFLFLKWSKEENQNYIKSINNYYKYKYPYNKGAGKNNLFQFFLERNLSLLKKGGDLYYLTPSIWMFADSGENIRKYIFNNFNLKTLYQFQNEKLIFKSIASNYKFCIYNINNTKESNFTKCFFLQNDVSKLQDDTIKINLSLQEIKAYSPHKLSIIELSTQIDKNIIFKAYKKFNTLENKNFIEFTKINEAPKTITTEKENLSYIKVFEGKTMDAFNSQAENIRYWVDPKNLKNNLYKNYRLAYRDIARNTDSRTLVSCILPKNNISTDTLVISKNYIDLKILLFTQALFNSIICDYIIRRYVDLHVSITYLKHIPMPQPNIDELQENEIFKQLIYNSALLSYIYAPQDFIEFVEKFNLQINTIPLDEIIKERFIDELKVQNDCLILKLYEITNNELKYILSTYKALNNKSPQFVQLLLNSYND